MKPRALARLVPIAAAAAAALLPPRDREPVRTPFASSEGRRVAELRAPPARSGFHFAVLGDRTNGPESGLEILRVAAREIAWLDPDFVMTVGDLINGYNRPDEWLAQMRAYRAVMDELPMPWYPVVGNHDVYPPGDRPGDRTNESLYLEHFGPLWYSFDHEFAHFVVLYSDENLSYANPAVDQRMSDAQLRWLEEDLARSDRRQAFLFLHHPRWNYPGDPWAPVHAVLAKSGKVRAVFAGHWHRYRSDGERDGIRYYLMAATGGSIAALDRAGSLHHWNLVSVREDGFTMGVIPVGSLLDPDFVTGRESDDCVALLDAEWASLSGSIRIGAELAASGTLTLALANPAGRALPVRCEVESLPAGIEADPRSLELELAPGERRELGIAIRGNAPPACLAGGGLRPAPHIAVSARYRLHGGAEQSFERRIDAAVEFPPPPAGWDREPERAPDERVLALDGRGACAIVASSPELQPDAQFTLECWVRVDALRGRTGLVNSTESSGFGFFLEKDGALAPSFLAFVDGAGYAIAQGAAGELRLGEWTHIAGTFDGTDAKLWIGGRLVAAARQPGRLLRNTLPLVIGADVDGRGRPTSFVDGAIDEVRLSGVVRYDAPFEPGRRHRADPATLLLLHFDAAHGDRTPDVSGRGHHAALAGAARIE